MYDLTANELRAALVLVKSCLHGMGGKRPSDLEFDEFTWVGPDDLQSAGWSKAEAAGTFSALAAKALISEYEPKEWILNTSAWKWLDTVWDENYTPEQKRDDAFPVARVRDWIHV